MLQGLLSLRVISAFARTLNATETQSPKAWRRLCLKPYNLKSESPKPLNPAQDFGRGGPRRDQGLSSGVEGRALRVVFQCFLKYLADVGVVVCKWFGFTKYGSSAGLTELGFRV